MDPFANVLLRNLDLHFKCQALSCYAFPIAKYADSGCPWQIRLDSHGPRRGAALALIY